MADRPYNVLFLCTGNSARSIIAEAIANRIGGDKLKAYSAGSMPTGQVNPFALSMLERLGHDVSAARSKGWEEFSRAGNPDAPELDFVFTVCDNAAGEVCPIWPGQPMTAHWGVPDPAAVEGSDAQKALAFADTFKVLNTRITLFANLPIASLDKMSLQQKLGDIGKAQSEPGSTAE
jgi:arsenate reductase